MGPWTGPTRADLHGAHGGRARRGVRAGRPYRPLRQRGRHRAAVGRPDGAGTAAHRPRAAHRLGAAARELQSTAPHRVLTFSGGLKCRTSRRMAKYKATHAPPPAKTLIHTWAAKWLRKAYHSVLSARRLGTTSHIAAATQPSAMAISRAKMPGP